MAAFVFISGIHRTNGSDNEQLFGKSHSLFTAPKAKPSPSQGKAGMRGVACGTPRAPVCCGSSSSSSSNTVQGSVLLPHYRTLEVRPGRISSKSRFVRPVPGSRYTMRRSSSWTMTCRLINFYNCMHSFQCGFEVVFTVNVAMCTVCFMYFLFLLFTAVLLTVRI